MGIAYWTCNDCEEICIAPCDLNGMTEDEALIELQNDAASGTRSGDCPDDDCGGELWPTGLSEY